MEAVDTILSVDLGTTALKTALLDNGGRVLARATNEYALETPDALSVEVDVETYWQAFKSGVASVLAESKADPAGIRALGLSAQGETLILTDRDGHALRPAIVWLDNRAQGEAEELAAHFGNDTAFTITGQVSIVPTWPASKILWVKRHERAIFDRTAKFLLIEDYFIRRLTGHFVCEGSLITSTVYWDITTKRWWPDMLEYLGVSEDRLPEIRESGEAVGPILPDVASELGLSPDTVVCTGALDQAAGAIGVGNIAPGIFSENTGAALAICATVPRPTFDPGGQMPCHYHGLPNLYMEHTFTSGGMVLRWFRDAFCQPEIAAAKSLGVDSYDLLGQQASEIPPGCEGLVMLPHLQGAMAPEANPKAKGVFYGFTLRHGKAHYIRAIMEAIACIVQRNIAVLNGMGIQVNEIRSLGGGARSRVWNHIKADVTGLPLVTTENEEAACLGAGILAGKAVGMFPSIEQAVSEMVVLKERFQPNPDNAAVYAAMYARYCELYENLRGLFEKE
jgi:xylulokinase